VVGVNENKAKVSQPAGAGVGAWLSLAKLKSITPALHRLIFEPIGKLSQPNSASTLVRSDMIMGRNLPYQHTHHQELLRHFTPS
jgi:hypothetical protein